MVQGEIEGWEKTELPPEPTWPMVTLAQREIYRQSVRIAELEASTRESVRVLVMERHRAEKAEATIARVREFADNAQGWFDSHQQGPVADAVEVLIDYLRAALEGEQQ